MRLGDLVDAPSMRLRWLHRPEGAADRPVRRAVVTDLLAPARYLTGGELVVTGLVWRRRPEHSERFVSALVAGGAIALAAGDALLGSVPDDLVEACRRHDLPLLEVPVEVAFADISELVAGHVDGHGRPVRPRSVGRQRELLSALASGRSLDELLERVSQDLGRPCRILSATGRHVVAGPGELAVETVDRLTRAFLETARLPTRVPPGGGPDAGAAYEVLLVGSGLADRLSSWFLVLEEADATTDDGDHGGEVDDLLAEIAAIAALDRSRREEGLRAVRHVGEEAVSLVASAAPQRDIAVRLRQAALDPRAPLVAVVAGFTGSPDARRATRTVVEDVVGELGPPVTSDDGETVTALVAASDGLVERLRRAFGRLAPGLDRSRLCVGVSSAASLQALSGALEEARYARRLAEARRTPVAVVTADEVTSHVILLATVPDDVRRTFATRVLGPVLAYDERTDAGLARTLETFLGCSGSWSRTAEALHVHVNTVRYRIQRVEELTGRDLSSFEDRVDVFLALRSL